jgi:hypothetical protein
LKSMQQAGNHHVDGPKRRLPIQPLSLNQRV